MKPALPGGQTTRYGFGPQSRASSLPGGASEHSERSVAGGTTCVGVGGTWVGVGASVGALVAVGAVVGAVVGVSVAPGRGVLVGAGCVGVPAPVVVVAPGAVGA